MSSSGDNTTFARTIKLLVANLDKTKERIQDRFMQVDERIDELESLISSVQQNLRSRDDSSTKDLMTKVEILSSKVDELETKLKDVLSQPRATTEPLKVVPTSASSSVPKSSATPPLPGSPPVAKPNAAQSSGPPVVGGAPTPKMTNSAPARTSTAAPVPTTSSAPVPASGGITPKPSGPPLPGSTPVPTSSTASVKPNSPPPSAGTSTKPTSKISIKDNKSEKDQLLEALKQLEGI